MSKMKKCKSCGEEVNSKAVVCPKCGVKCGKPVYKKGWFILLAAIVVIGIIGSNGGENSDTSSVVSNESAPESKEVVPTENITYTAYNVSQLLNDLSANALKAEETYNKQYVKLTGELSNVDSDGKYISLTAEDGSFHIISVQCYIKNEEQKSKVLNMNVGDTVVLEGKIKNIGEILGYQLDIDEIL